MKKFWFALLAALLIGAILVAGCGGGNKSSSGSSSKAEAAKILEESSKKMQSVKTVTAKAAYTMNTSGSSSAGNESVDMTMEMQMDVSNKDNPQGRIFISGMGQNQQMYLSGGYAYMEVPGQGWVKTPAGDTGSLQQASPAELEKFTKDAQNLRIVSDSGDTYVIGFDVSSKVIEESLKSEAGTESLGPEVQQMMNEMLKNMKMSAEFTINKSNMYVTNVKLSMSMKDVPMVGNMDMVMDMKFSDYDKPVSVTLPPEAANAKEVSPEEAGSLPQIPGLGF